MYGKYSGEQGIFIKYLDNNDNCLVQISTGRYITEKVKISWKNLKKYQ